jgi:hypothetical protein
MSTVCYLSHGTQGNLHMVIVAVSKFCPLPALLDVRYFLVLCQEGALAAIAEMK